MRAHKSQMVWFRWLYITFSRYMVVNTFREVHRHSNSKTRWRPKVVAVTTEDVHAILFSIFLLNPTKSDPFKNVLSWWKYFVFEIIYLFIRQVILRTFLIAPWWILMNIKKYGQDKKTGLFIHWAKNAKNRMVWKIISLRKSPAGVSLTVIFEVSWSTMCCLIVGDILAKLQLMSNRIRDAISWTKVPLDINHEIVNLLVKAIQDIPDFLMKTIKDVMKFPE